MSLSKDQMEYYGFIFGMAAVTIIFLAIIAGVTYYNVEWVRANQILIDNTPRNVKILELNRRMELIKRDLEQVEKSPN